MFRVWRRVATGLVRVALKPKLPHHTLRSSVRKRLDNDASFAANWTDASDNCNLPGTGLSGHEDEDFAAQETLLGEH